MEKIKEHIFMGIRAGIVAFILYCVLTLGLALFVEFRLLDSLNDILNGTLTPAPQPGLYTTIKLMTIIMNLGVFNSLSSGSQAELVHIGFLLGALFVILSLWIAGIDRSKTEKSTKKKLTLGLGIEIIGTAISFGLFLFLITLVTEGDFMGISIRFVNPINFIMTIVLLIGIQLWIGLERKFLLSQGLKALRDVIKLILFIGLGAGLIGLTILFVKGSSYLGAYATNIFFIIISTILIIPNLIAYVAMILIGAPLELSDSIIKLLGLIDKGQAVFRWLDWTRFGAGVVFMILLMVVINRIKTKAFLIEVGKLGIGLSIVSFLLAYGSYIGLGSVKSVINVTVGFSAGYALLAPLFFVAVASVLVVLIRYLISVVRSGS